MNKTLYLIRGLPGSGKSTFAKELASSLGAHHCEADMYHIDDDTGEYLWKAENVHDAHRWCQEIAEHCMEWDHDNVVISNTFTTEKELKPYLELASRYDYRVVSLVVENRHGNESIHGVPEETMQKMERRFSVKLRDS